MTGQPITILCAEDDEDDRLLLTEALFEARLVNDLRFVGDGEELLDYLHHRGRYADEATSPKPGFVLLDLNMPRMGGQEALAAMKADPALRRIPVVILTTSKAEEDVLRGYDSGASSYIMKPVTFDGLVDVMRVLGKYWLGIVELPENGE